MVLVNRNVAPSFNTINEILQNDQRKIKLIRKYENTRKKIINNECAILFNKTCINESLLPKYIYIYIYKLIGDISIKLNDSNCIPKINRIKTINVIALLDIICQNKRLVQQSTYKHRD